MLRSLKSLFVVALVLISFPLNLWAQNASYYEQAASLYDQAAAKCTEPGASCMRRFAAYNRCLAAQYSGGGSCGVAPSCSTACTSSASAGGNSSSTNSIPLTGNSSQQLAQAVGDLLGQWSAARAAKKEREAQQLQDRLEQESAQLAAESQAEDERAHERAAFLADPTGYMAPGGTGSSQPATGSSGDSSDDLARQRAQLYALAHTPDPSGDSSAPAGTPSDSAGSAVGEPSTPDLAAINAEEDQLAQNAGPDWLDGLHSLEDQALTNIQSAIKAALPDPMDMMAKITGADAGDTMSENANSIISGFMPKAEEESPLGALLQERGIDLASDKLADALSNTKDQLACSGSDSEVSRRGCMVLLTPSNIARGTYSYGTLLVERYSNMMEAAQSAFFPGSPNE